MPAPPTSSAQMSIDPNDGTISVAYPEMPAGERKTQPTPAVPVVWVVEGIARADSWAFVDSGASSTALPKKWAPMLSVTLDEDNPLQAWGNGVFQTYLRPLESMALLVAGRYRVDLANVTFGDWDFPLLGRDDFFNAFRVLIDERRRVTRLAPYDRAALDPERGTK
jgi:hypothetical protein